MSPDSPAAVAKLSSVAQWVRLAGVRARPCGATLCRVPGCTSWRSLKSGRARNGWMSASATTRPPACSPTTFAPRPDATCVWAQPVPIFARSLTMRRSSNGRVFA